MSSRAAPGALPATVLLREDLQRICVGCLLYDFVSNDFVLCFPSAYFEYSVVKYFYYGWVPLHFVFTKPGHHSTDHGLSQNMEIAKRTQISLHSLAR